MAYLPENNTYETGIYQLELTDEVMGGANGISNLQGKQLANRTKYLKSETDRLETEKASINEIDRLETEKVSVSTKGQANGVASLDANARVPYSQLPTDFISFNDIYPIGSIYISIGDITPNFGEWEKLATGKTLWNDNTPDGREIEAGLPNITGEMVLAMNRAGISQFKGAFYGTGSTQFALYDHDSSTTSRNGFLDARRGETDTNGNIKTSGQVFGNSNTVQPPAIAVSMWKRTA